MAGPGIAGGEDKARTHASVRAMTALYKLLGWIALGVGFGFAVTLFTFAGNAQVDTDKIIALAGGLVCLMLTLLIFVLTYGFAEILKMLLEIEDSSDTTAKRIGDMADKVEVVSDEPPAAPKIEEIKPPPTD